MESTFITITEAVEKTGRSASTIRRVVRTITETEGHPDRDAVTPLPKEVAAFKKKGENFTWNIREDVLLKNLGGAPVEKKKKVSEGSTDILSVLEKELELKNRQIEKQWEVIHALNDRLREGNILMGSLQKRLGPPQAEVSADAVVETSAMNASTGATHAASKPAKKRFFSWGRK